MSMEQTNAAPAVHCGTESRPINEVRLRAARAGAGLAALGVGHGDRYAIVLRSDIAFLEATAAAAAVGAVPVPVNWHWTGADLRHLLHDSGSKVAIVHSDLIPAVEKHAPEGMKIVEAEVPQVVQAANRLGGVPLTGRYPTFEGLIVRHEPVATPNTDPPMGVIYTSGTTGLAKGILRDPIRPADSAKLAAAIVTLFGLKPGSRTLVPAPLYHTAPNVHATFALALGLDTTIMPRFDPLEFLRIIQEHRIQSVQVVPTMFRRLLQLPRDVRDAFDLSSLEYVVHAAAPCPSELKEAAIAWLGPIVHEYYGGSEGGPWVFCDSREALSHPGTVGRPCFDADIRILDAEGNRLASGEAGIVYGKAFTGWPDFTYLGNDARRREIERDGYITVGDIGHVDADGFLYLSDRLNDMVVSGGVNIYPAEIEASIQSMPGVADAAVFGIPDPDFGEALAAHVQPLPGAEVTEQQIRDHVAAHLAKYKVPRVVVLDAQLPREDTGKLFKRRLKAKYWPEKPASSPA